MSRALALSLLVLALVPRIAPADEALGMTVSLDALVDLDGHPLADPGSTSSDSDDRVATVLLFTRADCPISNRYAPELRRLHGELAARGVRFLLVYPDPQEPVAEIRDQHRAYGYPFPALRDPELAVTLATGATTTPEAAVLDRAGRLVYRGRIDDRWVDFGKQRAEPTEQDLRDVLLVLAEGGDVEPRATTAVGCYIPGVAPTDLLGGSHDPHDRQGAHGEHGEPSSRAGHAS